MHLSRATPTSIISVTIPKSGKLFLSNSFTGGLGLPDMQPSPGYVLHDYLDEWRLWRGRRHSSVSMSHAAPSIANRRLLEIYFGRWHVHLRDPRSVTLSWTHHLKSYAAMGEDERRLVYICWDGPEDDTFLDWDFDHLLDWNVRNFLPRVVAWQHGWLKMIGNDGDRVLLTNFADLVTDPEAFLARTARFFGVPEEPIIAHSWVQDNRHFRAGRTDEWQEVFTAEQKQIAAGHIGDDLLQMTNRPLLAA